MSNTTAARSQVRSNIIDARTQNRAKNIARAKSLAGWAGLFATVSAPAWVLPIINALTGN